MNLLSNVVSIHMSIFSMAWRVAFRQCELRGNDNAGNVIAICYTSTGDDIAGWMVRNGYAIDWPKYSNGFYAVPQNEAQRVKTGIWQHNGTAPWKISEN